jgi:hypothetical protein
MLVALVGYAVHWLEFLRRESRTNRRGAWVETFGAFSASEGAPDQTTPFKNKSFEEMMESDRVNIYPKPRPQLTCAHGRGVGRTSNRVGDNLRVMPGRVHSSRPPGPFYHPCTQ